MFLLHWRRHWQPTPVLLPGKSHGQRSLVGCSPWGWEESDMTERLHFHFSFSCIGEENGNPLQCSCLENPRDGGAWWAAVYGVTQSRTRLKWLSSSSSSRIMFKNKDRKSIPTQSKHIRNHGNKNDYILHWQNERNRASHSLLMSIMVSFWSLSEQCLKVIKMYIMCMQNFPF